MKRSIDKSILALTLPAVASNITVPLLGLCDTAVSGHLGNESYLAAIATGSMMFNVIYLLCGFLRMATTGLTAEAYGRNSQTDIELILTRSSSLAGIIGIGAVILQIPLMRSLEWIIDPQGESQALASEYFLLCVWGAPAFLLTMSINGWIIGMQNTMLTMIVSVSVNIVNIVGSLIFVFVCDYGFRGVALGTLCANWFGVILSLVLLRSFVRKNKIKLHFKRNPFAGEGLKRFFSVSGDLVLRSMCILLVTLAVTSLGARMGERILAINTVMMQFFLFFTYFMDGFAYAGEALCGKWSGSGDKGMLKLTIQHLFKWTALTGIVFTVIYLIGNSSIVSLITDVNDVRAGVREMRLFLIAIPLVSAWAFILDGIFIGFAATRRMFLTILVATVIFVSIAISGYFFETSNANYYLWLAFLSYLFIRGIGLLIQLPVFLRKSK